MTRLAWKLLAGAGALLLLIVILGETQRAFVRSERLTDCQAIAAGELGREKGERCPGVIIERIRAAAEAEACVSRLSPLASDPQRWAAPSTCSSQILELTAAQNMALDQALDRDRQIVQLRSGQSAAIARAHARGASQARSYANAQAAIEAAPRDPSGLVVCDPECMRRLAGGGASADPRSADLDPR